MAVEKNEPLELFGNGQQRRTFLFVSDLIKALRLVINNGTIGQIYNIGSGIEITMEELAKIVLKLTGSNQSTVYKPHFIQDHSYRLPALELIKGLGWSETISLEDGIRQMLLERQL
jgi:dTDP-glucose 4,6-dehydratase